MKKFIAFLFLSLTALLFAGSLQAQQNASQRQLARINISGVVVDSITGERIEFVSMQEKGTTNGTITNTEGAFRITTKANAKLAVTCVGYVPKIVPLGARDKKITIQLAPNDYQLSEVVVKPKREHYRRRGNPSVELARNVIDHRFDHDLKNHDYYTMKKYENTTYSFNNFNGPLYEGWKKKFANIDAYVDTALLSGCPILTVSTDEKVETYYWSKNPKSSKVVLEGQQHAGLDEMLPPDMLGKLQGEVIPEINIDDNDIYLFTSKFVNPLSPFSIAFYKFYILDTIHVPGIEEKVIDLGFAPLMSEQLGFIGHIYVSTDSTFFVRRIELNLPSDINLNFISDLRISVDQDRLPDSTRVILSQTIDAEGSVTKNTTGIYARRRMNYSDFRFDLPDEAASRVLAASAPRLENPSYLKQDELFWVRNRVGQKVPPELKVKTMMAEMREDPWLRWGERIITWFAKGYVPIRKGEYEDNPLLFGPLTSTASYNSFEGLRARVGGITTAKFSEHWFLDGYTAYGFKDQTLKYNGGVEYSFKPKKIHANEFPIHSIKATYKYDMNELGMDPVSGQRDNGLLSLKRDKDPLTTYQRRAELMYRRETWSGFSFYVKGIHQREISTYRAPFIRISDVNMADNTVRIDPATSRPILGDSHFDMTMASLQLRFAPHEQFVQTRINRHPINHQHPIFELTHTAGAKGTLGSDFDYQRTDFHYTQRYWLSAFGYIDTHVHAGKVWTQSPYSMLCIPNSNTGYTIQSETFALLRSMEFLADQYASVDLVYFGGGWLFNMIPLLNKLKLREVISYRAYYGSLTDKNDPTLLVDGSGNHLAWQPGMSLSNGEKWLNPDLYRIPTGKKIYTEMDKGPYMEIAFGVENIFKLFRVDYIRRINYIRSDDKDMLKNGIQVTVHLNF